MDPAGVAWEAREQIVVLRDEDPRQPHDSAAISDDEAILRQFIEQRRTRLGEMPGLPTW